MSDRITSEPAGIRRVGTVAEQRWRERTEAAEDLRDSKKRKPRPKPRRGSDKRGGIDEFA